jgi:hypothetical protein
VCILFLVVTFTHHSNDGWVDCMDLVEENNPPSKYIKQKKSLPDCRIQICQVQASLRGLELPLGYWQVNQASGGCWVVGALHRLTEGEGEMEFLADHLSEMPCLDERVHLKNTFKLCQLKKNKIKFCSWKSVTVLLRTHKTKRVCKPQITFECQCLLVFLGWPLNVNHRVTKRHWQVSSDIVAMKWNCI